MVRRRSRRQVEQDAAEDVGGQLLLSFALLEGLLPVGGGELEDAVARPGWEQAEQVPDVDERIELVETGAREKRDEAGVGHAAVVAADEDPVPTPGDLSTQVELGDVVVDGEPAVVEDQYLEIARSLERGMWIEFEGDDGQLAFAKLAWISPLRGTYLFTNRQGQKALSMTAEELAERFRADRARPVEAEPLLDRALTTVMGQIEGRLAAEPA